jgi:sulfur relay (sulfurtransferase) DsrC/TusE family protein
MKNIAKDFDNYFQALEEYDNYLKEIIKKYNIKPPAGNLVKRLAFNIHTDDDNSTNSKQQHFKFLTAVVDWQDFFPNV